MNNFINILRQLLLVQITKPQKDTDNLNEFLRFWDLSCAIKNIP